MSFESDCDSCFAVMVDGATVDVGVGVAQMKKEKSRCVNIHIRHARSVSLRYIHFSPKSGTLLTKLQHEVKRHHIGDTWSIWGNMQKNRS